MADVVKVGLGQVDTETWKFLLNNGLAIVLVVAAMAATFYLVRWLGRLVGKTFDWLTRDGGMIDEWRLWLRESRTDQKRMADALEESTKLEQQSQKLLGEIGRETTGQAAYRVTAGDATQRLHRAAIASLDAMIILHRDDAEAVRCFERAKLQLETDRH